MRIGLHVSRAGSLENAALKAHSLGANTLQIFSSSPRMWRPSRPDPADIRKLAAARDKHDLRPLVIHDSYLINLASCDETIRRQSIAAFRGELERAIAIGAEFLVMHPGNCKGQTLEAGLLNVIDGLAESAANLRSSHLTVLLENTVGSGEQIGSRFEELAVIRKFATERMEIPVGYCLDTCHCFASGNYDVSTAEGLQRTVVAAISVLGLEYVHVLHTNDSKGVSGSHLDRHANIGNGRIGAEAFGRILRHPKLNKKAFILETPDDNEGDHIRDINLLKTLASRVRRL